MLNELPYNLLRLVLLLLAQVLVFGNLHISPLLAPNVFPLFVFLLPFETPRWLLMLLGMLAGMLLDSLLGTMGQHAAACLLIGYLRPFLITIITPKGSDFEVSPNVFAQGFTWFLIYLGIGMLVYVTFFTLLEAGTFYNFFLSLLKALFSTILSLVLMFCFLYLFSSRKSRRFVS